MSDKFNRLCRRIAVFTAVILTACQSGPQGTVVPSPVPTRQQDYRPASERTATEAEVMAAGRRLPGNPRKGWKLHAGTLTWKGGPVVRTGTNEEEYQSLAHYRFVPSDRKAAAGKPLLIASILNEHLTECHTTVVESADHQSVAVFERNEHPWPAPRRLIVLNDFRYGDPSVSILELPEIHFVDTTYPAELLGLGDGWIYYRLEGTLRKARISDLREASRSYIVG